MHKLKKNSVNVVIIRTCIEKKRFAMLLITWCFNIRTHKMKMHPLDNNFHQVKPCGIFEIPTFNFLEFLEGKHLIYGEKIG